jgi:hypothetical protein
MICLCMKFHMVQWLIKVEALAVMLMFEILQKKIMLTKVSYFFK